MEEGDRRERTREKTEWEGVGLMLLALKLQKWDHESRDAGGLRELGKSRK